MVAGSAGSTTAPGTLLGGTVGVITQKKDIGKSAGGLQSTGYVYIGEDPASQDDFDVEDESGQREFTTVKLFRDDIEEFL